MARETSAKTAGQLLNIEHWGTRGWFAIAISLAVLVGITRLISPEQPAREMTQMEFEDRLLQSGPGGEPGISDVVVNPVPDGYQIRGNQSVRIQSHDFIVPFVFYTPRQYTSLHPEIALHDTKPTVLSFLDAISERNASFHYRYDWMRSQFFVFLAYTIGSLLLIGVVAPLFLRLLTNAGFGRRTATTSSPAKIIARDDISSESQIEIASSVGRTSDEAPRISAGISNESKPSKPMADDVTVKPAPAKVSDPAYHQREFYPTAVDSAADEINARPNE